MKKEALYRPTAPAGSLKETKARMPVKELCRKHGLSDAASLRPAGEVRRTAGQ